MNEQITCFNHSPVRRRDCQSRGGFWAAGILALWLVAPAAQCGVLFTNLVSFAGTNGSLPYGGLMQGADGSFYGTTYSGGASNSGVVFRMTNNGTLKVLASFSNSISNNKGTRPQAGLVQGADGNFYGTTSSGGANGLGTVFELTNNNTLIALASFNNNNGAHPQAALAQGSDGSFYGTTVNGGISDLGTVFKLTGNVLTNLVSFAGTNGWLPYAGLVQGTDGSFYGTTSTDTTNGSGTVFNVTTNGTLTSLYLFTATDPSTGANADGANPSASLVQGADGNFYGTTQNGGAYNSGTIFQMTPGGTLTSLYSFTAIDPSTGTNADGVNPSASLVQGPDGNFYGTTQYGGTNGNGAFGYGTVFQLTPQGALTTLYSFGAVLDGSDTPVDGANPYAGLVLGRDGQFYGTTLLGGANNLGAIYRLTVPMASALRLVSNTETNLTFNWSAVAGLKYLVQYSTNLSKTNWSNLGGTNTATNGIMTTTDSFGSGQRKFYRVVLLP